MTQPTLPEHVLHKSSPSKSRSGSSRTSRRRPRKSAERTDVLVSAVISTYLLTHLHHILQRAEYGAAKEGHSTQAKNFAQLRKVLCMDARSMEDASAAGLREGDIEKMSGSKVKSKAA